MYNEVRIAPGKMMTQDTRNTIDAIRSSVARLERRVRFQRATESAVTGLTLSFLAGSVWLVLAKTGWIADSSFWIGIAVCLVLPVAMAGWAFTRALSSVSLAQRLDRAHSLHDRLSTALTLAEKGELDDFELAQIRDAARFVDSVDIKPAAPFQRPKDLIPFAVVVGLVGFIAVVKTPDHKKPLPEPFTVQYDSVLDEATVALERDRLESIKEALADVDDPEARELVKEIEELLDKVENREISEKEFLEELERIEEEFFEKQGRDEHKALADKLSEAAEELQKDAKKELEKAPEEAKELVEALKKKDFEGASKAMEELAKKLEKDEMSAKDLENLAKLMEKFSDLIDPNDPDLQKLIEENKALVEKLQDMFDKGDMNEGEKRRLQEEKKRQKRLSERKKKQEESQAARQLKQLKRKTKDMADKAKNAASEKKKGQKKGQQKDPGEPDYKQEMNRSAKEMKRALDQQSGEEKKSKAREMAKEQLEEMREAMRRQSRDGESKDGESGQKGQQMKEFLERAKGQKGDEEKEGSESQKKAGKGDKKSKKGEKGKEAQESDYDGPTSKPKKARDGGGGDAQEADFAGKSEGDRELGEKTDLDGKRKDEKVQGEDSGEGKSRAEIIKTASEEGFATTEYKDVYVDYESVVEEVMDKEKIPAGYRYYIKRYFQLIKPQE